MSRHYDEVAVARILAGKLAVKDAHEDDRDAAIIHLHTVEHLSAEEAAWRLKASKDTTRRVLAEWQARQERLAARRVA